MQFKKMKMSLIFKVSFFYMCALQFECQSQLCLRCVCHQSE